GGIMDKLFSAGKRLLTGESLFMTLFQNTYSNQRKISFASPYPGKILPIDLNTIGGKFICQKDAFLCANQGVKIGIEFSRKLGRGLFGGEGFIMQRLEGSGLAFIHAGGTMAKIELQPGEMIKVDTGCVVGFTQTVDYDVQLVGGIRNTIFGGEGLFFATLKGPGTVYVQSLPFSRLAGRIWAAAPQGGGKHKGEGSLLGGLGNLLDGDNR
ncbi:MAG TPA: AIM24 family protein, partial [Flavobacterium sp.]|nr:AIM24 family protein [Flavobacterium sp.]